VKDKKSFKPRGFGFVTYAAPAGAQSALDEQARMGGLEVWGRPVECRMVEKKVATPLTEAEQEEAVAVPTKMFVGGSDPSLFLHSFWS
jgi:hypothetical protein